MPVVCSKMPTALVTGANRGIGREAARQLAERGYDVIVSAREEDEARLAAEEVGGRPLQLDVSDPASIERAAAAVRTTRASLDVLVNNAGIGSDFGVSGTEPDFEAIQRALDTNFFGAYRLSIALLPLLRRSEHAAHRERVERHGRHQRDGRLVARLPRIESCPERDDAHPRHRARGRRRQGELGLPRPRRHRHGDQFGASKPVEDGASGVVWLATLPDDGPTGGFFRDGRQISF